MTPTPIQNQPLPIMALVNGTFAAVLRNPMNIFRACLFPALLTVLIMQWQSPEAWGAVGYHLTRALEWVLLLWLWTASACQLQRFFLQGPMTGATRFLPRLDRTEGRFMLLSILVILPYTLFAVWYQQPLYLHQPDLIIMGSITALDGTGELLYASLVVGWATQLLAYSLPMIADGDRRSPWLILGASFHALRHDFSRLFAASLLVALPIWAFFALARMILHMPAITAWALQDEGGALVWSFASVALEAIKIFLSGSSLAILWSLAYGRWRQKSNPLAQRIIP